MTDPPARRPGGCPSPSCCRPHMITSYDFVVGTREGGPGVHRDGDCDCDRDCDCDCDCGGGGGQLPRGRPRRRTRCWRT
eukprot:6316510-Pyramimonas_sp.AAC.2